MHGRLHSNLGAIGNGFLAVFAALAITFVGHVQADDPKPSTVKDWNELDADVMRLSTLTPSTDAQSEWSQFRAALSRRQKDLSTRFGNDHFLTRTANEAIRLAEARSQLSDADRERDERLCRAKAEGLAQMAKLDYRQAVKSFQEATEIADALGDAWRLEYGYCQAQLAIARFEYRQSATSITRAIEKAMAVYEQFGGPDHPWHLAMRVCRHHIHHFSPDNSEAPPNALFYAKRLLESGGQSWVCSAIGGAPVYLLVHGDEIPLAEEYCQQWLQSVRKGSGHRQHCARADYYLAFVLLSRGRQDAAAEHAKQALRQFSKTSTESAWLGHITDYCWCAHLLSRLELERGDREASQSYRQLHLELVASAIRRTLNNSSPARRKESLAEAIYDVYLAQECAEKYFGPQSEWYYEAVFCLCRLQSENRDFELARHNLSHLKAAMKKASGEKTAGYARCLLALARVEDCNGNEQIALELFDEAIAILTNLGEKGQPRLWVALYHSAWSSIHQGDVERAKRHVKLLQSEMRRLEIAWPEESFSARILTSVIQRVLKNDVEARQELEAAERLFDRFTAQEKEAALIESSQHDVRTGVKTSVELLRTHREVHLAFLERAYGKNNPRLLGPLRELAKFCAENGDSAAAKPLEQRATRIAAISARLPKPK